MQALQAASLLLLFTSVAFQLSKGREGSGEQDPEGFQQQISDILTTPQPIHEVRLKVLS